MTNPTDMLTAAQESGRLDIVHVGAPPKPCVAKTNDRSLFPTLACAQQPAEGLTRYLIEAVETVVYRIKIDAPDEEAAHELADQFWGDTGDLHFNQCDYTMQLETLRVLHSPDKPR